MTRPMVCSDPDPSGRIWDSQGEMISSPSRWRRASLPPDPPGLARSSRLALLAILAICAATYLPLLGADFAWDDEFLIHGIAERESSWLAPFTQPFWEGLQPPDTPEMDPGYYRPLQQLEFLLLTRVFGPSPAVFHGLGLLLHVGCGLLLFGLIRRLGALGWVRAPQAALDTAAIIVCGFFLLHPAQQETVAFVAAHNDLWATLAVLGAAHLWLGSRWFLAGPILLAGLLTKENAAVGLPLILAIDWLVEGNRGLGTRLARGLVPLGALAIYLGLRLFLGQVDSPSLAWPGFATLLAYLGHYAAMLSAALPLTVHHHLSVVQNHWAWPVGGTALVLLLAALAWWDRGSRPGTANFMISLLLPAPAAMALGNLSERYLYLPLAMLGLSLGSVLLRLRPGRRLVFGAALVMGIFAALNATSIHRWSDSATLFAHAARRDPTPQSYTQLGVILAGRGRFGEAIDAYREAASFDPPSLEAKAELGALYLRSGRFEEGLAELDGALTLGLNARGDHLLNRASCQRNLGRFDEAAATLRRAHGLDPSAAAPLIHLAALATLRGDRSMAARIAELLEERGVDPEAAELEIARLADETRTALGELSPASVEGLSRPSSPSPRPRDP